MARLGRGEFGDMNEEGERVKARRERLGMEKIDLARAAGVHRNTLAALENGESYNRSTLRKVELALGEAEHEAGIDTPRPAASAGEPHMVTIRGTRGGDVDVVVSGPIEDIDKLAETVERLLLATEPKKDQGDEE